MASVALRRKQSEDHIVIHSSRNQVDLEAEESRTLASDTGSFAATTKAPCLLLKVHFDEATETLH